MSRMDRLSPYATTISRRGNDTLITYHSTVIVTFDDARLRITLNTGGWDSVTTRRKMNQASRQFGLGYSVYRDKGESFVEHNGRKLPLECEVVLAR